MTRAAAEADRAPEDEVDPVVQVDADEGALQGGPVQREEVLWAGGRPGRQLHVVDCAPALARAQRQVVAVHQEAAPGQVLHGFVTTTRLELASSVTSCTSLEQA